MAESTTTTYVIRFRTSSRKICFGFVFGVDLQRSRLCILSVARRQDTPYVIANARELTREGAPARSANPKDWHGRVTRCFPFRNEEGMSWSTFKYESDRIVLAVLAAPTPDDMRGDRLMHLLEERLDKHLRRYQRSDDDEDEGGEDSDSDEDEDEDAGGSETDETDQRGDIDQDENVEGGEAIEMKQRADVDQGGDSKESDADETDEQSDSDEDEDADGSDADEMDHQTEIK